MRSQTKILSKAFVATLILAGMRVERRWPGHIWQRR